MLDIELEGRAPYRRPVEPAVVDPQILSHVGGIVAVVPESGPGTHVPIDIGLEKTRVRQCAAQGHGMVFHGVKFRCDGIVAPTDADDHRITRSHGHSCSVDSDCLGTNGFDHSKDEWLP